MARTKYVAKTNSLPPEGGLITQPNPVNPIGGGEGHVGRTVGKFMDTPTLRTTPNEGALTPDKTLPPLGGMSARPEDSQTSGGFARQDNIMPLAGPEVTQSNYSANTPNSVLAGASAGLANTPNYVLAGASAGAASSSTNTQASPVNISLSRPEDIVTTNKALPELALPGEFNLPEDQQVTAERKRMERNNMLREEQAKRQAHEKAVQAGFPPGSSQYEQMMRNATSDANNQNIEATNQFNDFVREMKNETEDRAWRTFDSVSKYIPSDKGQQAMLAGMLGGQDPTQIFRNMYNPDGTLKSEYQDMNEYEFIMETIRLGVEEMDENWGPGEKEKYIQKIYKTNFENIVNPSLNQGEVQDELTAAKNRAQAFSENGDLSTMQLDDWKYLTSTQREAAKAKGYIVDWVKAGVKSPWHTDKPMTNADAVARFQEGNPSMKVGAIVEKDGELYKIARITTHEVGGGRTVDVKAVPVSGGPETDIFNSNRYQEDY